MKQKSFDNRLALKTPCWFQREKYFSCLAKKQIRGKNKNGFSLESRGLKLESGFEK